MTEAEDLLVQVMQHYTHVDVTDPVMQKMLQAHNLDPVPALRFLDEIGMEKKYGRRYTELEISRAVERYPAWLNRNPQYQPVQSTKEDGGP